MDGPHSAETLHSTHYLNQFQPGKDIARHKQIYNITCIIIILYLFSDLDTQVLLNTSNKWLLTGGVEHSLPNGCLKTRAGVYEYCVQMTRKPKYIFYM